MILIPDKNVNNTISQQSWFSVQHFPSNSSNKEYDIYSINSTLEDDNNSNFKMIKIRLLPNKKQVKQLQFQMNMFAWYYNVCISIFYKNEENLKAIKLGKKYSYQTARNLLYRYKFNILTKDKFVKRNDDETNEFPIPNGLNIKEIHNRLPRSAVKMFVSALNSSNTLHKGDLSKVNFKYKTKKAGTKNILYFEDESYPKWINSIKGYYSTSKHKKVNWNEIRNSTKNRSVTIQYDNLSKKVFLYWPVDKSVIENQESIFYRPIKKCNLPKRDVIAIDPGIRTFCTVYSSKGDITEICNENNIMYKYHKRILEYRDKLSRKSITLKKTSKNGKLFKRKKTVLKSIYFNKIIYTKIKKIHRKIRNKVDDLHWKSIQTIDKLGEVILYPIFNVQSMLRQLKFPDSVKRVMSSLCFYKFKSRLKNKLENRVRIIKEHKSTKTCCNCGKVDENVKSNHVYNCKNCKIELNRDWNGAINILKMNVKIRKEAKTKKGKFPGNDCPVKIVE